MNIAIIENSHFEVAYTVISLFDNGRNKITVFVHEEAYQQLRFLLKEKTERYSWVIKKEEIPNRAFLDTIFSHIHSENFDVLYLNGVEDNFVVYARHLKKLKDLKAILTLHDINGFFGYRLALNPFVSLRRIVRYIGKRRLIKQVPSFNVLSENLAIYLRGKIEAVKEISHIPGSFFDPESNIIKKYEPEFEINIVVPGAVDTRRRDYKEVFKLLESAEKNNLNVFVILLGRFTKNHSEEIKTKCLQYKSKGSNLQFYNSELVDQPEFDKIINRSHFVWMPLQDSVTISDGIAEKYGTSTCSGNIGDVVRHSKPFFIPQNIAIDKVQEQSAIRYADVSQLITFLQNLTPEKYKCLQEQAFNSSLFYTIEKIKERNPSIFSEL